MVLIWSILTTKAITCDERKYFFGIWNLEKFCKFSEHQFKKKIFWISKNWTKNSYAIHSPAFTPQHLQNLEKTPKETSEKFFDLRQIRTFQFVVKAQVER